MGSQRIEIDTTRSIEVRAIRVCDEYEFSNTADGKTGVMGYLLKHIDDEDHRRFVRGMDLPAARNLARYFLACSDPQGFEEGDNLADIWFNAKVSLDWGCPAWWPMVHFAIRGHTFVSEDEEKNS